MEFKIGDVVRLKSGSLNMTVDKINTDNGLITCIYLFAGEVRAAVFSPEQLKIDEKD